MFRPRQPRKSTSCSTEEGKVGSGLRVFVQGGGCSGFQYGLMIEENGGVGDQVFESNGVRLFIDPVSISY
jgi:iron-sulfur cluster insertion protein